MCEFSTIYEIVSVNYATMAISRPFTLQWPTAALPAPSNILPNGSVANPGFPRGKFSGNCRFKLRTLIYYLDKFSLKTAWKWKNSVWKESCYNTVVLKNFLQLRPKRESKFSSWSFVAKRISEKYKALKTSFIAYFILSNNASGQQHSHSFINVSIPESDG